MMDDCSRIRSNSSGALSLPAMWLKWLMLAAVSALCIYQMAQTTKTRSLITAHITSTVHSKKEEQEQRKACFLAEFPSNCSENKAPRGWCTDMTSNSPRFVGDGSGLVKIKESNSTVVKAYRTLEGYQQCLANKHIVFIGDSRVRYQYITLIDYLRTGQWLRCHDQSLAANETYSPNCFLIDHEHGVKTTWNEWYKSSSEAISDVCDCHRDTTFNIATTYENRYVRMASPFGPIKITYLQNFQDSVKFHSEFPPLSPYYPYAAENDTNIITTEDGGDATSSSYNNNTSSSSSSSPHHCQPGLCAHAATVVLNTADTLLRMVPKLHPTHVFAQTGWKHHLGSTPNTFGCVLDTFMLENPVVKAYAISHFWERGAVRYNKVPLHGCNATVFDRVTPSYKAPASWYWDKKHVLSILNQEMNHQLLDYICGPVVVRVEDEEEEDVSGCCAYSSDKM